MKHWLNFPKIKKLWLFILCILRNAFLDYNSSNFDAKNTNHKIFRKLKIRNKWFFQDHPKFYSISYKIKLCVLCQIILCKWNNINTSACLINILGDLSILLNQYTMTLANFCTISLTWHFYTSPHYSSA